MRMPAVIVGDHRDGDVTDLRFARELGFLQVGHADHVHAPTAIDVRLSPGGKLRTFHAQVSSSALAGDPGLLARAGYNPGQFGAYGVGEGNVSDNAVSKKCVHAMTGAVEELIGNHKLQRPMLVLQRSDGGDGNDPLDSQLLEPMNVGAKI